MKKIKFDRSLLDEVTPRYATIALLIVALACLLFTVSTALGYAGCIVFLLAAIAVERVMATQEKLIDATMTLSAVDAFKHACQLLQNQEAQGLTGALVLIRDGLATRPVQLHALVQRFWMNLTKVDMHDTHTLISLETARTLNLDDVDEFAELCEDVHKAALGLIRAGRGISMLTPSVEFRSRYKLFRMALKRLDTCFVVGTAPQRATTTMP